MKGIFVLTALTLAALAAGCARNDPPPARHEGAFPQVRYQVDTARNRAWFLTRNGVHLYDLGTPEKVRQIQLPDWQWAGEPYSCMPDLTLGPKGEALVSSDVLPRLWRIDPDTLAVSKHELALDADTDKDVGFSGLAYSAEQGALLALSYHHGSLWRIDPSLDRAQKILLSAPIQKACGLAIRSARQGCGWSVDLAPDQRSGYVSTRPCSDHSARAPESRTTLVHFGISRAM